MIYGRFASINREVSAEWLGRDVTEFTDCMTIRQLHNSNGGVAQLVRATES